jgi:hypothetical protein
MTSMTAASRRCVVPSPSGPAACPVTVTPAPPAAPAATLRAGEGKSIRESGLGEGRLPAAADESGRGGGHACCCVAAAAVWLQLACVLCVGDTCRAVVRCCWAVRGVPGECSCSR